MPAQTKIDDMWYLVPLGRERLEFIEVKNRALIGREGYEVVVSDGERHRTGILDGSVSRRHAELVIIDKRLKIRDLGSLCGTSINCAQIKGWRPRGKPTDYAELLRGDILRCGAQTEFKVERKTNTITLRKGESMRLPREIVKELIQSGMEGSDAGEPYVMGAEKGRFRAEELTVEVETARWSFATLFDEFDKLRRVKEQFMEDDLSGYEKLSILMGVSEKEIDRLCPQRCRVLHEYVKLYRQGCPPSGGAKEVIEILEVLMEIIRKKAVASGQNLVRRE
ncbi:MAG: FHA domain-containing protein [Candidatus Thermoplasmatota archaeon]